MKITTWIKKNNIFGEKIYFYVLIIIAISLPLSPFILSVSQIWLAMNYLLEGKYESKIKQIAKDKVLWAFLLLPLIHLIWLFNTMDFGWAKHDLLIKLPALSFPIIIATSNPLSKKRLQILLWFFIVALFSGTVISMFVKAGYIESVSSDYRGISIFISHIRFSLMIVLGLCFIIINYLKNFKKLNLLTKTISPVLIVWFLFFLGVLKVLISWILIIILLIYLIIILQKKIKNIALRISSSTLLISIPITIVFYVSSINSDYKIAPDFTYKNVPTHSPNGKKYSNDFNQKTKENGNYVYIQIFYDELEETWNKRSKIAFDGKDKNGHSVKHTLLRYLTSLGYSKDANGIMKLTDKEISYIEEGITNHIYIDKSTIYTKVYEIIWEIDYYKNYKNANNMSIPMRIEFLNAGKEILKNNLWLGVGTGDIKNEYENIYNKLNSNLTETNRLRAHNQFITFIITFGIIGGTIAILAMFLPFFMTKYKSPLLVCFFFIIFVSMLSEDTLETQAGITFYCLFYPFLIYNNKLLSE